MAALADTPDDNPTDATVSAGQLWSPGRRLGGRYRLERLVRGFGGSHTPEPQLWVGVDELLNRKVGVDLIAADHPLLEEVARAARDAAAVPDARFVQVLDAVRDEDLLYIVTEWVPGAEQLGERLNEGPMSPAKATAMIREAAEAMVRAHEAEVAHGALNPATVLITATGQVKLRGLLVEATLGGASPSAYPADYAADVLALGRIWYAALTALWPQAQGEFPLYPAPRDEALDRPYSPAQVRAAVPKQVDTAVRRALGLGDPDSAPTITTVKELADVIRSLPRLHDELAEPTSVLPRSRAREAAPTTVMSAAGRPADLHDTPPNWASKNSGRSGGPFWRRRGVLAVAGCAALALATLAAFQFSGGGSGTAAALTTGGGTPTVGTVTIPPGTVGSQLSIADASVWDDSPSQSSINAAKSAFDGTSTNGWKTTTQFQNASFNGSYSGGSGIGLIFDLSGQHELDEVKFQVPFSGGTVEVLTAGASASASPSWSKTSGPAGYTVQGTDSQLTAGQDIAIKFAPVTTQYVMVLFTTLPYESAVPSTKTPPGYRDGLIDVRVYGA